MRNKANIRRHWIGSFFLGASVVMLIAGETVLSDRLSKNPWLLIIYWLLCFLSVMLAVFVAVLDIAVVRRRTREEQRNLVTETLDQIVREKEARSKKSPPEN